MKPTYRFRTLPGIVGGYSVYQGATYLGTVKPVTTESVKMSPTRSSYFQQERWQHRKPNATEWEGYAKKRKDAAQALDFAARAAVSTIVAPPRGDR